MQVLSDDTQSPHTYTTINHVAKEPYRYQCPDWESHSLVVRDKFGWVAAHLEADRQETVSDPSYPSSDIEIRDFRCRSCSATFDDPYDKKRNERRTLRDDYTQIG